MYDSYKGRLKMFCRLLILIFYSSLCWTPTVSHVVQKRAAFYIANETMCIVDGDVYWNGDPVPTDDECERCTCRPPGFSCVLRDCDTKPGCKAVRRVGECCPEYVCGCVHNSRLYEDGELIKDLQNNCYTCRCHGSSISCTFADCRFRSDCPPDYIPGECCPRYDHCPLESITTSSTTTTTTTTEAPSSHIIQQELEFFNLTTQHVQKFTTAGTTVKIEDITTNDFTTPTYTHTVKFTLSGEKISSIHDFDTTQLTTLLPLQTVTYTETTKHILPFEETELTTIKDGLSTEKTSENVNIFESEAETEVSTKTATDTTAPSHKVPTDDFYDTSTKVSFPENNVVTVLTEDVSEWEDDFKTVQEAESSAFDGDSKEEEKTTDFVQVITDEISQQESGFAQTEIPLHNDSMKSTFEELDLVHETTPGGIITSIKHSESSPHDQYQTETEIDFKSVTQLVSSTTIDDETITRNETESADEDLQSTLEVLHSVTSPKTSEIATTLENLSTTNVHAEYDDASTTLITNFVHSTTSENSSLDVENKTDSNAETNEPSEDIDFTTSDKFPISADNDLITTEIYQDGETSIPPSQFSTTTSEIPNVQVVHVSSHSTDSTSETSHPEIDSITEHEKDLTKIEQTQTVIDSTVTTDSDQVSSMHVTRTKGTSHDSESTDKTTLVKEIHAEFDDLSSTHEESTSNGISPTTYSSIDDHSSSLNEIISHFEQDKTSDNDYSNEIITTTIRSTNKDVPLSFNEFEDLDKIDTTSSSGLDTDVVHSTEHSVSDRIDTSVTDKKHGSTIDSEVTEYNKEEEITKVFEENGSPNKTDFDFSFGNEDEEAEAESQEITTESLSEEISSIHPTHKETLHSEDAEINIQTNEDKTTVKTMITEQKEITNNQNNIDFITTHESSFTPQTSAESITSLEKDVTELFPQENSSHVLNKETFSITTYSTENPIDTLKLTESDTKEIINDLITTKTGSSTDDLVYIMAVTSKIDQSSSQQSNTPEILLQPTTLSDKKEEVTPLKQDGEYFATRNATITQTSGFVETTSGNLITEKTSTTTEDDMPNELPAFEHPLANILKQQLLFNRPVSQKEPSDIHNVKSNLSKETSDENEVQKSSLTVDETDKNSLDTSDLDESGNKIFTLNHLYTIQDSEIPSTTEIPNKEESDTSDENNLYFAKTEYDDIKTSSNDQTSTQNSYQVQFISKVEDLSSTQLYGENNDLSSSTEILDSEELTNEVVPKEKYNENGFSNDSLTTSLHETTISFNFSTADSENNIKLTETPILLIDNSEINSIHEEASTASVEESGVTVENTPTINLDLDTSDQSTLVDIIDTEGHLNESTNPDLIDELFNKDLSSSESSTTPEGVEKSSNLEDDNHEPDSDFVYEDAESLESSNAKSTIQTSVFVEELPKHSFTSLQGVTFSFISDENKTSTETQSASKDFDYTSITSDSAKDEYLAALKFSTLYGQKFFTTLQHYPTYDSTSSKTINDMSSTLSSDTFATNEKTTTGGSFESAQYEHSTKEQQSHAYAEENSMPTSVEDSENESKQDSPLTITPTEEESLLVSKDHSDASDNFSTLFSTLNNLFNEVDTSTNEGFSEVTTQSNIELLTDENKLESSSSTEVENLTLTFDQTYGSRLKNEFAEYGVLGGVFITGKSKYKKNVTDEDDTNSTSIAYSNAEVEQEKNPLVENKNVDHHNNTGDFEVEKGAEADYSAVDLELSAKHATTFKNEEDNESDSIASTSDNNESIENEINLNFSMLPTSKSSEDEKLIENFTEIHQEFKTTVIDETNAETLSVTTMSQETHVTLPDTQTDSKADDDGDQSSSAKTERGPEKGGDWFEPTDPNLILEGVEKKGTTSDALSQPENTDVTHKVSNESTEHHGPEKGGEVFEPTFPDVFPIDNANSDTESDTTVSTGQISTRKVIDLNKDVTSVNTMATTSKSEFDTSTESNIKFQFVPPMPILLRSLPKLIQQSYGNINSSEIIQNINDNKNSNVKASEDYMSDEQNIESAPSYRNLNPSYDLSGIISKVFKAPGYDAEIHLRSLKDHFSLNQDRVLRPKRDVKIQSEAAQITHSGSEINNEPPFTFSEGLNPFNSKNILLVEGYGQKQSNFVPVTSSVIIVHSDEENETDDGYKLSKPGDESKDILFSELRDKISSTNPEKDDDTLNKSHPKV